MEGTVSSASLSEPATAYDIYSAEQRELMSLFEQLPKNKRKLLIDFVRGWVE